MYNTSFEAKNKFTICIFNSDHCFHCWSSNAISVYIYILSFLLALSVGISRSRMRQHGYASLLLPARRIKWFPTLITLSFILRGFWLVLKDIHAFQIVGEDSKYHHVQVKLPVIGCIIDLYPIGVTLSGKLATLLYFSAFTIILRFWDDILKSSVGIDHPVAPFSTSTSVDRYGDRSRTIFVIVNLWMYVAEFAIICTKTFSPMIGVRQRWIMDVDSMVVAIFFLVLSLVMICFGYQLERTFGKIEFSTSAKIIRRRVIAVSAICSSLFLFRAILFLFALSHGSSKEWLHTSPWLSYTIPEVIPGVTVLLMMMVKREKKYASSEFQPLLRCQQLPELPEAFISEVSL